VCLYIGSVAEPLGQHNQGLRQVSREIEPVSAITITDIGIRRRERKKLLRLASFLLFRVALQLFLELLVLYHLIGALPDHLIGALPDFFISDFGLLKSHRSQAGIFTFINSFRC